MNHRKTLKWTMIIIALVLAAAALAAEAKDDPYPPSYPNITKREARHWNRTHECVCGSGTPNTPACLEIEPPCRKDDCCAPQ
jgi:hypothetical protein